MALLLSEDRRFHEHSGVDWWAVSAAAWGNLWHERTRGASTLTMQLAGLLDSALQRPASTARGLSQKWGADQCCPGTGNPLAQGSDSKGLPESGTVP